MKFYCDACNTKYAIPDDKVRGKVLKVRCKSCGNVITLREAKAPAPAAASSLAPKSAPPATNWYYAINGQTSGPFTLTALRGKYETGQIGDETYVWHDTFPEWKPVRQVELFADALARGQSLKPRHKTLGFTGPLQAIRPPEASAEQNQSPTPKQASSAPSRTFEPERSPEPRRPAAPESPKSLNLSAREPRLPKPSAERPAPLGLEESSASEQDDARREKLERLREKLRATRAPQKPTSPKTSTPVSLAPPSEVSEVSEASEAPEVPSDTEGAERGLTFGSESGWDSGRAAPAPETSREESDAVDFDLPKTSLAPPPTSSTSDIFDGFDAASEAESGEGLEEDSGAVPFFPEAPKLGSPQEASRSQQLSGSLLIQIDQIKKKGRGKMIAAIAGAATVLIGIGSVAAYLAVSNPQDEASAAPVAAPAAPKQKDELVIRRYKESEHAKLKRLDLGEISFSEDEVPTAAAEEAPAAKEPAEKAAPRKTGKKPAAGASASKKPKAKEPDTKTKQTELAARSEPKELDPLKYRAATSRERTIERPTDELLEKSSKKTGLSKEDARRGFRRVGASVQSCYARHARRGAPLEAKKIFVTVEVMPTGKVSSYTATPNSVEGTEFDRCMQSHKGRWRFASFQGEPVQVRSRFILQ